MLQRIYTDKMTKHWLKIFLWLMIFSILFTFLTDHVLLYDDLLYQFYSERFSYEIIEQAIDIRNQWNWIIYVLQPLIYLFKFFLVTCALMTGVFFAENVEADFSKVFKTVIISEFIFLIPLVIKLVWFSFFYKEYTFQEMQYFFPLSIGSILDLETVPQWLVPFTLSFNLFELAYWMLLGLGISLITGRTFAWAFQLVMLSYGIAWLLYHAFIIFISINMS